MPTAVKYCALKFKYDKIEEKRVKYVQTQNRKK